MQPKYIKEKMDETLVEAFNKSIFNAISVSSYKEKYQYSITTKDNEKIKYYLYSFDEELWLASYSSANNVNTIFYILKLK